MPNRPTIAGFEFHYWNLSEATLAIQHFLLPQHSHRLTNQEIGFLTVLNTSIIATIALVKHDLAVPYSIEHYVLDEIYQQYKRQLHVTKNILSIQTKNFLALLEHYSPTSFFYAKLLKYIQNCFIGMEKHLNAIDIDHDYQFLKLYLFADSLGAVVAPFPQSVDLLGGCYWRPNDEFGKYQGFCTGYLHAWSKKIIKHGTSPFFTVGDQKIYNKYKNFIRDVFHKVEKKWISTPTNLSEFVDDIIPAQGDLTIYGLKFTLCGKNIGHTLGIRRIPATEQIELNDPNLGVFLFKEEISFKNWFTLVAVNYEKAGFNLSLADIFKLGVQPKNAKSCLPSITTKNILCFDFDDVKSVIHATDKEIENLDNTSHYQEVLLSFRHLTNKLSFYLAYLQTEDDLARIKFLLEEKLSTWFKPAHTAFSKFNLFAKPSVDPWQANKETRYLLKLIEKKQQEFNVKTTNSSLFF